MGDFDKMAIGAWGLPAGLLYSDSIVDLVVLRETKSLMDVDLCQ
jgi:hypothetical protein